MKSPQSILLVEDDEDLQELIAMAGKKNNYMIHRAGNGLDAKKQLEDGLCPDLIILDINMPALDGFGFCRWLREGHLKLPVIFLSARSDEYDKILALEIGGDDYLTKPFSMKELFTRAAVAIRRVSLYSGQEGERDLLVLGPLSLCTGNWSCSYMDREICLTVSEFRILRELADRAGRVLNRDQLARAAFPDDLYNSGRSIDIHISRIRSKLKAVDPSFGSLETVYQLGYRWKG